MRRPEKYSIMSTDERNSENVDRPACANTTFTNFSIDHILNRAGENCTTTRKIEFTDVGFESVTMSFEQFSWLQCTRYCPPKIPRNQRKEPPQRRQLGRHPRIPFTSQQLQILEEKFQESPYLTGEQVVELAKRLQLADIRGKDGKYYNYKEQFVLMNVYKYYKYMVRQLKVKIWFQNRRARDRREKFSSESNQDSPSNSPTSSNSGRTFSSFSPDFRISEQCIQQCSKSNNYHD